MYSKKLKITIITWYIEETRVVEYTILYSEVADLAKGSVTAEVYSNRDEKYSDVHFALCGVKCQAFHFWLKPSQDESEYCIAHYFLGKIEAKQFWLKDS